MDDECGIKKIENTSDFIWGKMDSECQEEYDGVGIDRNNVSARTTNVQAEFTIMIGVCK